MADDPDRFWDPTNWQGLCRPCHEAKTARENRTDDDGWADRTARLQEGDL